jgi:serine/threonine protein kinase/thioredoxin-like negative regulator of GroEL
MDNLSVVESIFFTALDKANPESRAAYLEEACGTDQELRQRVERLLSAHPQVGSFLAAPPSPLAATAAAEQALTERPGTMIGPYKLMEQIGEGGMGLVFVAEQQQPVRRKVALKVIKPGMDSRSVIARFEAERQALALMDHPNIARVLDAGATDSGRPYFVMELVKGVPITTYCDQNQLTPRERLPLFVSVCQAVQHAHQKGIIHRDLKPSNVLVTLHDALPVIKVIDFGVAKALGQQLTEKTIYTGFTQLIGTPLYMSPEQAQMSGIDADTRCDIYSLGVLLYELLTGTTPFDPQRLEKAAFDEVRRIIREEEPPRPSTRLSTLGQTLPSISAQRNMEPRKLSALVRGDLDWIVMKALEKDRTRRYESASAFAADVRRYLQEEPVEARPPSALYRFRKLARRHKVALTTTALLGLVLVLGAVLSTWQAIRATQAEQEARHAEAQAMARLDELQQERARTKAAETRETDLTQASERLLNDVSLAYQGGGKFKEVAPLLERMLESRRRSKGEENSETIGTMIDLGSVYSMQGHPERAEPLLVKAVALSRRVYGEDALLTANALGGLASVYALSNRQQQSLPLLAESADIFGRVFLKEGKLDAANGFLGSLLVSLEQGNFDGWRLYQLKSLRGAVLAALKKYSQAEPLLRQGYEGLKQREDQIPPPERKRVAEALARLTECRAAWSPSLPTDAPFSSIRFEEACKLATQSQRIVLLDFYTTWCAPCKKLDAITWQDSGVRAWLTKATVALKIDAEKETKLVQRYKIRAYPTVLLLRPDGTEIDRLVGYKAPAEFLTEAGAALAGKDVVARARAKLDGEGEDNPLLRMFHGDALAQKGRRAEALAEYLWCFDHGLSHSPAFVGVRQSFLLKSLAALGDDFAPLRQALAERRDAALRAVQKGDPSKVADVAALNGLLHEEDKTLALYDELQALGSPARVQLFEAVLDPLLQKKRYADIVAGAGDISARLDRQMLPLKIGTGAAQSRAVQDLLKQQAVIGGAKYYEALLGTERRDQAHAVRSRLLALDGRAASYAILVRHAARAGKPEEVEELLRAAEKTLSAEDFKQVEHAAK